MKLLVLSDLHVEFSPFSPNPVAAAAADVVVLAGDIHKGREVVPWARRTFEDKPVVLVAGNHEFYWGEWDRTLDALRKEALAHQVHFLENDAITLEGVRFLGTSLWTDFAYFGQHTVEEAMAAARQFMTDYRRIAGCTPQRTIERHQASRAWLERELARSDEGSRPVVVTHHSPSKRSTAARYRNDPCTPAFASQLPAALLDQAGLWIHGHTHSSHLYRVGRCRVVCNPRGYPLGWIDGEYENREFDAGLLMEQTHDGRWVRGDAPGEVSP